jgi:hypothetical protein
MPGVRGCEERDDGYRSTAPFVGQAFSAGAGVAQRFRSGWSEFRLRSAGDNHQGLQSAGDLGSFEAVVAMLALDKQFHKALGFEPVEVHAGG